MGMGTVERKISKQNRLPTTKNASYFLHGIVRCSTMYCGSHRAEPNNNKTNRTVNIRKLGKLYSSTIS